MFFSFFSHDTSVTHQQPSSPAPPRPRENAIRFTPVQVEAIRSGVNPGLTMVVGPPGTGKTDTAVQAGKVNWDPWEDLGEEWGHVQIETLRQSSWSDFVSLSAKLEDFRQRISTFCV